MKVPGFCPRDVENFYERRGERIGFILSEIECEIVWHPPMTVYNLNIFESSFVRNMRKWTEGSEEETNLRVFSKIVR